MVAVVCVWVMVSWVARVTAVLPAPPEKLPLAAEELKSFFDTSRFMLKLPPAFIPRCNLDAADVSLTNTHTVAGMHKYTLVSRHTGTQNLCIYTISPQLVQRDVHITQC